MEHILQCLVNLVRSSFSLSVNYSPCDSCRCYDSSSCWRMRCLIFYILKFNVPVGWLVRGLVCPAFTHQRESGSGRFICQKNRPGHGINLAGVISGSGHIQGAEVPPENLNTSQIPSIFMKFES